MTLPIIVAILAVGVVLALLGVVYLHGHKAGVESAIARATTIPSGVAHAVNSVVPGAATAAQNVASQVGTAVTNAADKVG